MNFKFLITLVGQSIAKEKKIPIKHMNLESEYTLLVKSFFGFVRKYFIINNSIIIPSIIRK